MTPPDPLRPQAAREAPRLPWWREAVFYQVNVRTFQDSNGDGVGDFPGLTARLPYLAGLGVDALWLQPFYPSPRRDDGYDVADYRDVHPEYGTLDDLRAFLQEAHRLGLRVVADLVLNHTSDQHPWFQAARQGPENPFFPWYVWSETGQEYAGARRLLGGAETSNWAWDGQAGKYYWHRFFAHQPDLNYDHPPVRETMLDVVRFWLDLGLDGFRVDAVPFLYEREGTGCENLPQTHAYIARLRTLLEREYPDRVLIAEANQRPQNLLAYFGGPGAEEFQMCFNFPLAAQLFVALARGDARPLRALLEQLPTPPCGGGWANFLRNHDELNLRMVDPADVQVLHAHYGADPRAALYGGLRRRLAPLLGHDPRRLALAQMLLLALPGTPFLYYGDEIGLGDDLSLPDRFGLRTPMAWSAAAGAGFSPAGTLTLPLAPGWPQVNVERQEQDPASLLHRVRAFLHLRRRHPALRTGETRFLDTAAPGLLAFERTAGEEQVLMLVNLGHVESAFELPAPRLDLDRGGWLEGHVTVPAGEVLTLGTMP
ncbi:trehalose synthase/amylase TreS [Deinococcus carri]|uniref:Trehalose synthase/amylase TreS n=1 Tax=Deinococcus carri TaxID=1211323 RepID=A0ABP9W974_9DEIO